MKTHSADLRFYEELNDFLTPEQRRRTLCYEFEGHPGIKDAIEAFGVPPTEVDLILVNGASAGFDYRLQSGDRVAVYPIFESFDISPLVKLRDRPLRKTAFAADANLGKLARRLRMLGFDTLHDPRCQASEIVDIAVREHRIVLTRVRSLLSDERITHGCLLCSAAPDEQVREVLDHCDLWRQIRPFRRCIWCNGSVDRVPEAEVPDRSLPGTGFHYGEFFRCGGCGKVY